MNNLNRTQVLADANAHAGALCFAFLYAFAAWLLLIGLALLIRRVLDALPIFTVRQRVDAALKADASRKYLQPVTARPQRRRAA